MQHTHSRSQRYGGHTKHTFYCSCGRQVSGNGGKQHFKLDGHSRISWEQWRSADSQVDSRTVIAATSNSTQFRRNTDAE